MVAVVERVEGHYDVRDVEFGGVYRWCPESVIVECGRRLDLTSSMTRCGGCGGDHAAVVEEELAVRRSSRDEALHPWRYAAGLPC